MTKKEIREINKKARQDAELASTVIKMMSKRWSVSPKDILKSRIRDIKNPILQARGDAISDLLGYGFNRDQLTQIFGYSSIDSLTQFIKRYYQHLDR